MRPVVEIGEEHDAPARGPMQVRFAGASGNEPSNVSGLFHTRWPSPVSASAIQIDHGCGRLPQDRTRRTADARLARKRFCLPSGDQRGETAIPVDGAGQASGLSFAV